MLPEGDRGNWQYESYCWSGTGLTPGMKKPPNREGSRAQRPLLERSGNPWEFPAGSFSHGIREGGARG